ncbi:TPA: stage 0 sporulation protein [bacterium]|nr:stage 0 sporulation protein [bacterium]
MLKEVVGVRFPKDYRINYCNPGELILKKGDLCVVRIDGVEDIANVIEHPRILKEDEVIKANSIVIRKATEEDKKTIDDNKEKEEFSKKVFLEKVKKHNLPMKFVDVHLSLDRTKYTFYFSADEKIDFKALVKELAGVLSSRIELYQIRLMDEMRLFGGISWCGREFCCSKFLTSPKSVSLKMAKEQNLNLSFSKMTGICGKFMCCLAFEYEFYKTFREKMPKEETTYKTQEGIGVIEEVSPIRSSIKVRLEDDRIIEVPIKV